MSLDITKYTCKIELTEDMLGTVPKNREVYAAHIAAKGREMLEKQAAATPPIPLASGADPTPLAIEEAIAEEVGTVEELEERGWTTFHTDEQGPFVFDYLLKGFLCESSRTLKTWGKGDRAMKQLQDKCKRYVFVKPRRIHLPPIAGCLERPLRAMTALGPRVALVRSDYVAAGTELSFQLHVLNVEGINMSRKLLLDVFEYGGYCGLGQWRSGGNGRFELKELEELGDGADDKPAPRRKRKQQDDEEDPAA